MEKTQASVEIVRLEGNTQQWEWERREADREAYFANAGKKAGLGVLAMGLVVIFLLSYIGMGTYLFVAGIGIMLIGAVKEKSAQERVQNLDAQLSWSQRRLAELREQLGKG